MTMIDPDTLREKLENNEDVCVVDIRSEDDYEDGHIEGSENRLIRAALLSGNVDEALAELDDLPDDEELIMVCDAGSPRRRQHVRSKSKAGTQVRLRVG